MAKLKLYPLGLTAYQPADHPRTPPPKTEVSGWTVNSTRSLVRWLYTVDISRIDGLLVAFTFTVRDCPDTPDDWKRLREAFFRRLRHQGVTTLLWLTEWQRRGVPHLHGIVVLPASSSWPTDDWCKTARKYRAEHHAQHVNLIHDAQGWMEYLAKHSARGVSHYQRNQANAPAGWQDKTGRMWGKRGNWPTSNPIEFSLDDKTFFRLRRLIRNHAIACSRKRRDWKSLKFARTMLRSTDPVVSRVRGLSRFCHEAQTLRFLDSLRETGNISC